MWTETVRFRRKQRGKTLIFEQICNMRLVEYTGDEIMHIHWILKMKLLYSTAYIHRGCGMELCITQNTQKYSNFEYVRIQNRNWKYLGAEWKAQMSSFG